MKLLCGLVATAMALSNTALRADGDGVYGGEALVQVSFDNLIPTFRPTVHVSFETLQPTTFPLTDPGIADFPMTQNLFQTSEQSLLLAN